MRHWIAHSINDIVLEKLKILKVFSVYGTLDPSITCARLFGWKNTWKLKTDFIIGPRSDEPVDVQITHNCSIQVISRIINEPHTFVKSSLLTSKEKFLASNIFNQQNTSTAWVFST